nr:hypothetical protein [Streptomyces roseoverticillatus]
MSEPMDPTGPMDPIATSDPSGSIAPSGPTASTADAARLRLAQAQHALLSALVADAPPPAGHDPQRLQTQRRALLGKRAEVVAKVAPELPEILGADFRRLFLDHARGRPMRHGYRQDALDFAARLLETDGALTGPGQRERLAAWREAHATADRATARTAAARPPSARLATAWRTLRSRVTRKATDL